MFLPHIRKTTRVKLVLYMARISKNMVSFDNMDVYQMSESTNAPAFSAEAVTMLNLFAGQLYFSSFSHYQSLCEMIGLWDGVRELPIRRHIHNDNFVPPACRKANGWTNCTFRTSPVGMLKAFIGMRRLGIEWSHTHMGRVLSGRILMAEDFEEQEDITTGMKSLALDSQSDSDNATISTTVNATSSEGSTDEALAWSESSESSEEATKY
jgi:hypothetical protein